MTSAPSIVFVSRLAGTTVFDPLGDSVGKVRDVVILVRSQQQRERAVGLVVEVPGRKRVFVPLSRVTSIDTGQVIVTGVVNVRRFEQRSTESLAVAELLDRRVTLGDGSGEAIVEDLAIEQQRNREWEIAKVFVRRVVDHPPGLRLRRRRGETLLLGAHEVKGLTETEQQQAATLLVASLEEMKPADIAEMLHDMADKRRLELARELNDERLADVLEELPEDDQVQILSGLGRDRATYVLEAMEPDDAADLLAELPAEQQEAFLEAMEPDDAEDLRRLLTYGENTAGGLMTSDPVVLPPEATIAEAMALVRRVEVSPFIAAAVFVCRPPTETPTGRYLGLVHIQRLLREPPHQAVGGFMDSDIEPLAAAANLQVITRRLATYNLISLPVTDAAGRLIGAVTADDVLDHLLPDDWREVDEADIGGMP